MPHTQSTSGDWSRIKKIFDAAAKRPPDERAAFVSEACAGDAEMAAEVQSLLSAHRWTEAGMEPPPLESVSPDAPKSPPDALIGQRIGPYSVLRLLGYGGMGAVYEARQGEGEPVAGDGDGWEPRRRVALKVVRGGTALDEHAVRLFRREVQALALLNHPGIAALYDAGRTEDGRHYFAMELIEGSPLTAHAEQAALSECRRLEVFAQTCDAIAYAHQRGVIHRDLKPSNILVGATGRPKVLDFGLARITDADVALTTLSRDAGKIQGTLAYMSPEQARGQSSEIDLRSDGYSLGVLLYELLTGELPYEVRSAPLPLAVRLICEEPPRRPSAIHRPLRGDLETILLKALEKEPTRRYQSVAELARDIRHYLAREPIDAKRDSTLYVLQKLVRRHSFGFAAAAAFSLLILGSTALAWTLYARATIARHEAEAVTRLLTDALYSPASGRGAAYTVYEMLDDALGKIDHAFPGQPLVEARVRATIGQAIGNLGKLDEAISQFKKSLAIREGRLDPDHNDVLQTRLDLGNALDNKGDYPAAESMYLGVIDRCRGAPRGRESLLVSALKRLGVLRETQGQSESAIALLEEALSLEEARAGGHSPAAVGLMLELATSVATRGTVESEREVEAILERAKRICTAREGEDSVEMAEILMVAGRLGWVRRQIEAASEAWGRALEIRRKRLPVDHPLIASAMYDLSKVLLEKDSEEALRLAEEALRIRRKVFGDQHREVALSLMSCGMCYESVNNLAPAADRYREAIQIFAALPGKPDKQYGSAHLMLARILRGERKYDEARRAYEAALEITRREWGSEHLETCKCLNNLAGVYKAQAQFDKALPLYREAVDLGRKLNIGGINLAVMLNNLATSHIGLGRFQEAEPLVDECLRIAESVPNLDVRQLANLLESVGAAYRKAGRHDAAALHLGQALVHARKWKGNSELNRTCEISVQLGSSLTILQRFEEAEQLLLNAAQLCADGLPANKKSDAPAKALVALYETWGRSEAAAEWRAKLAMPESTSQ